MQVIEESEQAGKYDVIDFHAGHLIDFHDGNFSGIQSLHNGTVLLWCSTVFANAYVLKVPEVKNLVLQGFRLGNAIFAVNVYEPKACPPSLFAKVSGLEGDYWQEKLAENFAKFLKTNGFLLEIVTSTGCDLLLLSTALPQAIEKEIVKQKSNPTRL